MISLFVFDLDGTLIDSRRDIADSANEVLVLYGHPPHSEEAIGSMVGEGAAVLMARVFAAAHAPLPPDALGSFLRTYGSRLVRFTRPYPGVPELLTALAERASLAVLTNKPLRETCSILDELGLARFFEGRVVGGDSAVPRKPAPDGLLKLMADLAVEPGSTLMVGDSVVDMRTARAAGTRACLARYGFGFTVAAADTLVEGDVSITSPLELLARL